MVKAAANDVFKVAGGGYLLVTWTVLLICKILTFLPASCYCWLLLMSLLLVLLLLPIAVASA